MKLYTEEQVKEMIDDAHNGIDGYYDIFKRHTPIELPSDTAEDTADYIDRHIVKAMVEVAKKPINFPSDEEIEERAKRNVNKYSFIDGVEWLKDKIIGGNK